MFSETARYYDAMYHWLDYDKSTTKLRERIEARTDGRTLLDVACGTGQHLLRFRDAGYACEGLDLDAGLLAVARERVDCPLHEADMCDFDLGRRFHAITNLFSSIGYAGTVERLHAAVACLARHLEPGGIALVEPWFRREVYHAGTLHMLTVDEPDLKLTRMNHSAVDGNVSVIDFHYLIGTPQEGIRSAREMHRLAMFSIDDFAAAAKAAGLAHEHVENEDFRRGLHVFTN